MKINLSDIRENPVALRQVNKKTEEYLGLVDSIRQRGFMGAITVRRRTTTDESGVSVTYYEIIDGLHRVTAAKDAGLVEIEATITSMSDMETLEAQIMANIHRIETKPIEYTEQLKRILSCQPLLTEAGLAAKLGKSPQWIAERLSLGKIDNQEIKKLINEGKITLSNAYALAKLPAEDMPSFVDRAITETPEVFIPSVHARIKQIKDERRKGNTAPPAEFKPVMFLQKISDIKNEIEKGERAAVLTKGVTNVVEAFTLGLKWALHFDPQSIEAQKDKDDARRKAKEDANKKRKAEAEIKKAQKAQEDAAKASLAAEEARKALGM